MIISKSTEETQELAAQTARKLKSGSILALYGQLGSGKTTFVQGLAKALGYKGKVFSPTFIFVRPYKLADSKIEILYHIDLYRLDEARDLKNIGIEEFLSEKGAVCVIEWPEKIENLLPQGTKKIYFEAVSENTRKITIDE